MERAIKAHAKKCPPNHCPKCFHSFCRLLYIDCCICTGHIIQGAARPFSNQ
jgi:hypothetical protein